MRRSYVLTSVAAVLVAIGLAACGTSGPSGFTARGRPPLDPSKWTWGRPTAQMADEAEALIASERGSFLASPECVPARSLDGTGEFNFKCTAEDPESGERHELQVVVFGSESGEPELGPVISYVCDTVPARGGSPQRSC